MIPSNRLKYHLNLYQKIILGMKNKTDRQQILNFFLVPTLIAYVFFSRRYRLKVQ